MVNSLTITRSTVGDDLHLTLTGEITEEARFAVGDLPPRVVMNLKGVRRVNSVGIREWMVFVRAVPAGTQLVYSNLPPSMVMPANQIQGFLGPGRVESFLGPYYCEQCAGNFEFLLEVSTDFSQGMSVAPTRECPKCKCDLVFDDVESAYFAFLGR